MELSFASGTLPGMHNVKSLHADIAWTAKEDNIGDAASEASW
jgi:hypothetical protein